MPMQRYHGVVLDTVGEGVATTVTVKIKATGAAATIYSDEGVTPKTNPTTSDASGNFDFYAADGDYILEAGNGASLNDVTLFSGAAREAYILKGSPETVTNSTTLQDDDDFTFAIAANEIWEFTLFAMLTSPVGAGFKYTFSIPAATTNTRRAAWLWTGTTIRHHDRDTLDGTGTFAGGVVALSYATFWLHGIINNGANAGNVVFRWAQETADVGDTHVQESSYLVARKVT